MRSTASLGLAIAAALFSVASAATMPPITGPRWSGVPVRQPLAARTAAPPAQRIVGERGWITPRAARERLFYVAAGAHVLIYPGRAKNPKPVGKITKAVTSAYSAYVDRHGMLYVTNWAGSPASVEIYPPGSIEPILDLYDNLSRPLYTTTDRRGNVFVGDANTGQVTEYLAGLATPRHILQTPGIEADGLAFSRSGDLYVAYRGYSSSSSEFAGIVVFRGGHGRPHDLGIRLNGPQGLAIDPAGDILVAETNGVNRVDMFPPGATAPSETWPMSCIPTGLAFDRVASALFVSCAAPAQVWRLRYPGGTRTEERVNVKGGYAQGMAVSPAERL
jgi:hypothetical protein